VEPTTAPTWARNQAEWDALIGSYLPQLKRFAKRHLPPQLYGTITADDLVQEVVLSGLRQLHRLELRHEQAFQSYLLTSIRHRIVDEIRRTRRQPAVVLDDDRNWSVDPGVSPLQRLITRENLRRYAKALACLADRDRQLIVLRLVRGLSCLDIAVRLGMRSEAAVRMGVKRALQRLEKRLNKVDSPSMSQGFDTQRLPQHSVPRLGASRSAIQGFGPSCGLRPESTRARANVV
jgi:RNA polymerase sigma factor (sigma-70 family)